jgi:hypothetical protein
MKTSGSDDFSGARVLITRGKFRGREGVCLGRTHDNRAWAISPDGSAEILELEFEKEFGLLVDLSSDASNN